ncbi:type IV pilus biogenesis/stability protein PilW [Neptunicella marina]|uniref:Type IV pilus biogenesis/stability protein PilW n=1 Tax=Neptunicella marina TaxID=2125989 RepID=A0A8J6LZL8_9ALTE|nr:type IV pilus biogenesis/stability protein PilW [Neptunicella marina]MBC3766235.1 type IV pilus biogenesis/stability protein PilW [Neptunicella marina]
MRQCLLVFAIALLSACASQPTEPAFKSSDGFDHIEAAKTRISLGLTYLKNDNYKQAKFNLDKALQFAPKLADTHLGLGYYYQHVGENALADQAYQTALKLKPNDADIANSYGAFLCQAGKYPQAKKYFLQAINTPDYIRAAETYENLALCSQNDGQVEDTISYLESALKHDPSRSKSIVMLIQLLIDQQRWTEAKKRLMDYEKAGSVSAETIWFWVQIETGLGNPERAQAYGKMLVQMYPRHPYAKQFIQSLQNKTEPAVVATKPKQPQVRQPKPFSQVIEEQQPSKEQQAASDDTSAKSTDDGDNVTYHVVADGENLYRISLKYNVRMDKLIEWNHLKDAGSIRPKMKLRVSAPE